MKIFDTEQDLKTWMKERGQSIHQEYTSDVDAGSESFIWVYEEGGEKWAVQGWGYYDGMYGTLKPRYYAESKGEHKGKYVVKKVKLVTRTDYRVEFLENTHNDGEVENDEG